MAGESEDDLPLHDEAEARSKWRGDGALPDKDLGTSGPASEADDSTAGGQEEGGGLETGLLKDLGQRPPD